ncbi:MAG: T9SS type A sorting domain-containing protein [Ignavibacteriae bacterium]|nr:T9SS C-terminal target domain-containing protein [Ignavibacteriota bacterium]NOG97749.1 T9SS type A sorting domain-containing protein [Ignavibacteriota bacterium]
MKIERRNINRAAMTLLFIFAATACFIYEVQQPSAVDAGSTFTTIVSLEDLNAETQNAHRGVLCILVPDDWTFNSGTYTGDVGSGDMVLNTDTEPLYGDVDTLIPPPADMKWVELLTDIGYLHDANVFHDAEIEFQVGQKTGDFPIGYLVTVNTIDMFQYLNDLDEDQELAGTDTSMNHMVTVNPAVGVNDDLGIPDEFQLNQNYPNPFNPTTNISFSLPSNADVKLTVFSLLGQEVAVLADGLYNAGLHTVSFDAANLNSGIYLYKIESNTFSMTRKMLLLK